VRIAKGEIKRHIPGTSIVGRGSLFADVVTEEAVAKKLALGERIKQSEVRLLRREP